MAFDGQEAEVIGAAGYISAVKLVHLVRGSGWTDEMALEVKDGFLRCVRGRGADKQPADAECDRSASCVSEIGWTSMCWPRSGKCAVFAKGA